MKDDKKPVDSYPLYNPEYEHDSCGVGFIANLNKKSEHKVIEMGLEALKNLTHRGAVGGDANTGDGAGILFQIPHEFFSLSLKEIRYLQPGQYGVGQIFLPKDEKKIEKCKKLIENIFSIQGMSVLAWRE